MIAPAKQSHLKGYLLLCLATSWEDSRPGKTKMSEGAWSAQPTTLCSFVDSLADDDLAELRGALTVRLCRKNYGTDTLEASLPNGGGRSHAPDANAWMPNSMGLPAPSAHRCPKCPSEVWSTRRDGLYEREADAPQDHKDRRGDAAQHSAPPRLIELTCKASHSTTFL